VGERRRHERTLWRVAILVSVGLHALLFLGWRGQVIPPSPFAAAGPRSGDRFAARGGMQAMNLRTPPSLPIVPPPVPLPTLTELDPPEFEPEVAVDAAAAMGDAPGAAMEAGLPEGTGRGDGGNADEGLFRLQPPSPRGMIIPPANRNLRGTSVEVWVFVDEAGRVVADSTRLNPPTRDRDFNRRLINEAAEWVFRPAMKGGEPVASWFPYVISM